MAIFHDGFESHTFDGATIEGTHNGFRFVATVHHDSDMGAPWDEHDGHGPVSDWVRRDKLSGELILCEDRGFKRFYDFAEACRIARRDGWGCKDGRKAGESLCAYAARAARHDFEVLRAWCNDEWTWCGITVQAFNLDGEELTGEYDFALWGIEMNYPGSDNSYLSEVANDLAQEIVDSVIAPIEQAKATVTALGNVGV
jgi:hypothetical protein